MALFCFWDLYFYKELKLNKDIEALVEKNVSKLGYELVDFEIINRGELLRIFIDKPNSITIDDCVDVTNQLKHILSVEDDISFDRLEVSSPGTDRVVKKLKDFERFKGEKIKIKTYSPIEEIIFLDVFLSVIELSTNRVSQTNERGFKLSLPADDFLHQNLNGRLSGQSKRIRLSCLLIF